MLNKIELLESQLTTEEITTFLEETANMIETSNGRVKQPGTRARYLRVVALRLAKIVQEIDEDNERENMNRVGYNW